MLASDFYLHFDQYDDANNIQMPKFLNEIC